MIWRSDSDLTTQGIVSEKLMVVNRSLDFQFQVPSFSRDTTFSDVLRVVTYTISIQSP